MKLKKIFYSSNSTKEVLNIINKACEIYLRRHQGKVTVPLVISAHGDGKILMYDMLSRYEPEDQGQIDNISKIVEEITHEQTN